ncbi:MAG: ABC transporter permease [Trueperaceae bacterium]|nr:MAG: ABC transporter permease [Trueperaceae bacterium]
MQHSVTQDNYDGDATTRRRLLRLFFRNRGAVIGLLVLFCWIVIALFAPFFSPFNPIEIDFIGRVGPSWEHPFGTDRLGRDLLSRVFFGARISLLLGVISVAIGLVSGTLLGLVAGYYGGRVETVIMRFVDALLAFPGILLALIVIAVLGPGLGNVMIAVGISTIPEYARLARSKVLSVKELPYIEAVKGLGSAGGRIMFRHILPNISGPLIVLSTLQVGNAILVGSGLSFLGMGAQPPTPEWGLMTAEGRNFLNRAWWISTFPGLAILSAVMAMNLIGDGLREALDPRMKLDV